MGSKAKEHKTKALSLGLELKYNRTNVEYFGFVPGQTQMLMVNSTKVFKNVFLDNRIENADSNRTIYNIKNLAICSFLNNRLMSKVYSVIYEGFVGNSTVFRCPVQPGVYYLSNSVREVEVPMFHPPGMFRLTVRLNAEKDGNMLTVLMWRYRVRRI
ncbi:uncharacterized protein LOC26526437 [Drosophila erecta]|uniref:MD-2-related lipid-recognition domain-containing protein n=1 Tax=Drosophila erecta TaxID=7220 RepID=A0A0Q5WMW7_DROER|nr:uncharacterized protein LOC26526437 [Drosophila erecta]KQS70248.1 uncharacterized protein Dere_GG26613 [Drosophila erecta]